MLNPTENSYSNLGLNIPIPSANIVGTGYMLNERVQYTIQTSIVVISTANSNLDGTGTLGTLIQGGLDVGTLVKRIIIKAQGNTTQGMIRIFFRPFFGSYFIMREIEVPAVTQSSKDESFIAVIDEPFYLTYLSTLYVSTEKAESFMITAEGLNMVNP